MTHDTINSRASSFGATLLIHHTIDITGTDGVDHEEYDARGTLDSGTVLGVTAIAQENPEYRIVWDLPEERLSVTHADGSAFEAAGEEVGRVRLRIEWVE